MTGIELIATERLRQVTEEGWTPQHDDAHQRAELAQAAVCYADPSKTPKECAWPWTPGSFKRDKHDRIKQLVIAGALIAAEIDRLQRAASRGGARRE